MTINFPARLHLRQYGFFSVLEKSIFKNELYCGIVRIADILLEFSKNYKLVILKFFQMVVFGNCHIRQSIRVQKWTK